MARVTEQTKHETREKLLDAAAREISEFGLDRANINRISTSAGFARGTVYNYFATKEEVFLAVVERACALAAAGMDDVPTDASTEQRLLSLVAADVAWVEKNEDFGKVMVRQALSGDERYYARMVEAAAPYMGKVAQVLSEGVERGEVCDDVPVPQLALVLVGLTDLALVQRWGSSGAWPSFEGIPRFVVRQFLAGAASRQ